MPADAVRLEGKRRQVEAALRAFGRVLVAFSGGVDSTLLAALARQALGRAQVLAVTADSPSLAREDLAAARQLARQLDLEHLVIETREVDQTAYRANAPDRCYHCKAELFERLTPLAAERGIAAVLYGAIGDDRLAERPGSAAAAERRVRAPLQEAGLTKAEVRTLARGMGLPNWDRPQNACLASRIPHGTEVTVGRLRQVEAAEAVLRTAGFQQVRVRWSQTHARIEVGPEEVARFNDARLCGEIARAFAQIGFETVGVDRRGYRAGGADASADDVPIGAICKC